MARLLFQHSKSSSWVLPLTLLLSLGPSSGFLRASGSSPMGQWAPPLFLRTSSTDQQRNPTATTKNTTTNRLWVTGPPAASRPDYETIHGPMGKMVDDFFLTMFRTQLARQVGIDSDKPPTDYQGLIDLVHAMNARFSNRTETHLCAQRTLSKYSITLFGVCGIQANVIL
jgi:hypothetical protein